MDGRSIMIEFFNNCDGMKWEKNSNWGSNLPLSHWHGITTDPNRPESIIKIELKYNKLKGEIPRSLFELSDLEILDLSGNKLSGNLPDNLTNLKSLTEFNISKNNMEGVLHIQNLEKILNMKIVNNNSVDISHNSKFELPNRLGDLKFNKKIFNLSNCSIGGRIPSSLGELSSIEVLDLSCNQFEGNIPSSIGGLTSLKKLFLNENKLNGCIPETIKNLHLLEEIYLNSNLFSGKLPEGLLKLQNLKSLLLCNNLFDGELSNETICLVSKMQNDSECKIDLSNCNPGFTLPLNINELSTFKIINLNLSRCSLRGSIPESFGSLHFEYLNLSNNKLSGTIPLSFLTLIIKNKSKWPSVLSENICFKQNCTDSNTATGLKLPHNLGELDASIEILDLSHCSLVSSIPVSVGYLANLKELNLSYNQLSATIPSSISSLEKLNLLNLSNNMIQGVFPNSIGNLKKLKRVIMNSNELKGELPSTLSDIGFIEEISFGNRYIFLKDFILLHYYTYFSFFIYLTFFLLFRISFSWKQIVGEYT